MLTLRDKPFKIKEISEFKEGRDHDLFVQEYWYMLAPKAWHWFQCYGRGALVIDFARPDREAEGQVILDCCLAALDYVRPSGFLHLASVDAEEVAALMDSIVDYDPTEAIIAVIIHSGGVMRYGWVIGPTLTYVARDARR